jgi:superfamily II DNA or RNA helicase
MSNRLEFFLEYARHTPAYKLGRWDGLKRFFDAGGRTYINLIEDVLPILLEEGYEVEVQDLRISERLSFEPITAQSYSHIKWPKGHVCEGDSLELREHQVEAINQYLSNPNGVGEISTGAGKTIITAVLSHHIEQYGRSIVIVPNKDLVTQTRRDYDLLGLDVGVYYGDEKEIGHKHTICTWQSLEALEKKVNGDITMSDISDGVVGVIVDEAHACKADKLFKHLTKTFNNCPVRWAMTGTIPLDKAEAISLKASIGNVICEVSAKELQDKGVLSNLNIDVLQIQDYYDNFPDYQSELKYLVSDYDRLSFIAEEHIMPALTTGNTLILVDRVATGNILMEIIPDAVFISGNVKSKDRKAEYDAVANVDNKPIIATFGVASTGIDIPRIFNVFMFEAGKSFVKVIQSIGRGVRRAKDKDFVNIYDVCSSCKYSKRHLTERKKYYKSKEYPHKVKKIKGHNYE